MKLIACDECHDVVVLKKEQRSCECGNISGRYTDNISVEITVKDKKTSRVLGLINDVRFGKVERGEAFTIRWDNPVIIVKTVKKTKQKV